MVRAKPLIYSPSNIFKLESEDMADSEQVKVETTKIETAPGVTLNDHQNILVGSVLDVVCPCRATANNICFRGKPRRRSLRCGETMLGLRILFALRRYHFHYP